MKQQEGSQEEVYFIFLILTKYKILQCTSLERRWRVFCSVTHHFFGSHWFANKHSREKNNTKWDWKSSIFCFLCYFTFGSYPTRIGKKIGVSTNQLYHWMSICIPFQATFWVNIKAHCWHDSTWQQLLKILFFNESYEDSWILHQNVAVINWYLNQYLQTWNINLCQITKMLLRCFVSNYYFKLASIGYEIDSIKIDFILVWERRLSSSFFPHNLIDSTQESIK